MNSELTDITLVVDRSGSMQKIREDAEGGVNAFIEKQAKEPGEALLTLVQFDTEYDFVHKGVAIKEVPTYQLVPRGRTALLDAVGRAINETGERLSKIDEQDRPGLVIFVALSQLCVMALGSVSWLRPLPMAILLTTLLIAETAGSRSRGVDAEPGSRHRTGGIAPQTWVIL